MAKLATIRGATWAKLRRTRPKVVDMTTNFLRNDFLTFLLIGIEFRFLCTSQALSGRPDAMRVLAVDDEQSILELLTEALPILGCDDVHTASNAQEALDLLSTEQPDIERKTAIILAPFSRRST